MKASTMKPGQELEAPGAVLALVRNTAKQLGACDALAAEAARTGVFELQSRSVSVVLATDECALLLCTPLDAAWAEQPARRQQALRISVSLMLQAGVAFCITPAGPALMCRWSLDRADAGLLAAWVREFAVMANLVAAGAATSTDSTR